jgi:hypothetical protein
MGRVLPVVASRMISGLVATVISSGGCAQLAGIDNTNNGGLADSVVLKRMSIGASVTTAALDLTGLTAKYYPDPGAAPVVAATTAAGTWTAKLPLPAPVELTLPPDPAPVRGPRLMVFPDPALQVLYPVLEHPNPMPAPDGATITLTVPLDLATVGDEAFQVFTMGSWTTRSFGAAELPAVGSMAIGPVSYDFATSQVLSEQQFARSQLDALKAEDAFLVLRYIGTALTGVAEAVLTQDQTAADVVTTATMVAVAADQKFDASIDGATVAARYATVRPAVNALGMSWQLAAAPGYLVGVDAGPVLQKSGALTVADTVVSVMYANPFASRSWNTLFTLVTSESRAFTLSGAMASVTLSAGMEQRFEPVANATAPAVLDLPAALPTRISLDAIQLTADGQTVAVPQQPVVVTFTADNANATLYSVELSELDVQTGAMPSDTTIERRLVYAAEATAPSFTLRPTLFQAGKSYVLRAQVSYGGYPNIATGDLVTRSLPLAQAFLDSAVFSVTP